MMYTMMNRPEMMMNRMIREFHDMPPRSRQLRLPVGFPVDVRKTESAYILTAELPGVKLDEISIVLENDMLTISADLAHVSREERGDYLIRERRGGHIERSFILEGLDQSAITADAADGLLTITLPKEAPAEGKGPRRIAINGTVPAIEAPAE